MTCHRIYWVIIYFKRFLMLRSKKKETWEDFNLINTHIECLCGLLGKLVCNSDDTCVGVNTEVFHPNCISNESITDLIEWRLNEIKIYILIIIDPLIQWKCEYKVTVVFFIFSENSSWFIDLNINSAIVFVFHKHYKNQLTLILDPGKNA